MQWRSDTFNGRLGQKLLKLQKSDIFQSLRIICFFLLKGKVKRGRALRNILLNILLLVLFIFRSALMIRYLKNSRLLTEHCAFFK